LEVKKERERGKKNVENYFFFLNFFFVSIFFFSGAFTAGNPDLQNLAIVVLSSPSTWLQVCRNYSSGVDGTIYAMAKSEVTNDKVYLGGYVKKTNEN